MLGFQFTETMSGTWRREGGAGGDLPMTFTCTAKVTSWWKHLRDHKAALDGRVQMDGFATDRPFDGELVINPILGRLIRYQFQFIADDGRTYHFIGQKDVTVADLEGSLTTLPASITDDLGATIGRAHLTFDRRGLGRFLKSFRPAI